MSGIIESLKEKYKKLGPVFCPYLNEKVYFTPKGLKHLIWKSELGMRSYQVIYKRYKALDVVTEIISRSGMVQEYENNGIEFFCSIAIIKNIKYEVVVMSSGNRSYKFLSIIPNIKIAMRDYYLY